MESKRINEAVKNNPDKFPDGYIIALTRNEWDSLKSKFSTSTKGGKVKLPSAFTEKCYNFPVLEILHEVRTLADIYFSALAIPEKARADAYHLAVASWHGIDFMVSWNCTHIVNGRIKMLIEEINARQGKE